MPSGGIGRTLSGMLSAGPSAQSEVANRHESSRAKQRMVGAFCAQEKRPTRRRTGLACERMHGRSRWEDGMRMGWSAHPHPRPIVIAEEQRWVRLDFQEQSRWIFDYFLDRLEEAHRFAAIDDAMIISQRQVHHRTDDDLTVARDRAFLNRMQT